MRVYNLHEDPSSCRFPVHVTHHTERTTCPDNIVVALTPDSVAQLDNQQASQVSCYSQQRPLCYECRGSAAHLHSMRTSSARSVVKEATQSGMPWLAPLAVSVIRDSRLRPLR